MDMLVLQALKVRDRFKALRQAVPKDMFDSTTIGLLNSLFFQFRTSTFVVLRYDFFCGRKN